MLIRPMLRDLARRAAANGQRAAGGRVTEIVADVIDVLGPGFLPREQAAHLAGLTRWKARNDVAFVHFVNLLEVLFERWIELLGPMASDPVEIGSIVVEIVPLAVGSEHQPQPRRIATTI